MPVRFTKHALERMKERDITAAEIFRVLAWGQLVRIDQADGHCWRIDPDRVPDEWRWRLWNLEVICDRFFCVMTAYWEHDTTTASC